MTGMRNQVILIPDAVVSCIYCQSEQNGSHTAVSLASELEASQDAGSDSHFWRALYGDLHLLSLIQAIKRVPSTAAR